MKQIEAAVVVVGAGLADGVDLPAGVSSKLSSVGICLNSEFSDRLNAQHCAGGAARRPVGEIVLRRSVKQINIGTRVLAVHAHSEPVCDDGSAVAMRVRDYTRLQKRQIRVVPAVQRQLSDGLLAYQVTQFRRLRIDKRLAAVHIDSGRQARNLHNQGVRR